MKSPRVSAVLCRHDNDVVAVCPRRSTFEGLGTASAPLPPRPVKPFVSVPLTAPLIKRSLVKAAVEPARKEPDEDDGSSVWTYVTDSSDEQQPGPVGPGVAPNNDIRMSVYTQFGLNQFCYGGR